MTFNAKVKTSYGQTVKVVGSTAQLGNWNVAAVPALSASQYSDANPLWSGSVTIPAKTSLEYKFVKVDGSGAATWESGSNRQYTVAEGCQSSVTVGGDWK